jgi:hypothetical protein
LSGFVPSGHLETTADPPASSGFEDAEGDRYPAHVAIALGRGGHVVAHLGSASKKGTEFVVGAAEASGCVGVHEPEHGSTSALDAAVVLLETVVEIAAGSVPHALAQLSSARIARG